MKNQKNFIDRLGDKLFSSTYQLQRIVILIAVVLVVAVASFGGYYYYDRYYRTQPTKQELTIAQAEQAMRDKPEDPNVRLDLALTYLTNRRFDDAANQAIQVKQLAPDNPTTDFVLGIAYANLNRCQDAVTPLTTFVDKFKTEQMPGLDKRLQGAAYYLGDCYLQLNRPKDAIPVLENTVNWSVSDADAMYKLGVAYAANNQQDKAINMFVGATSFVPDYTEAYTAMAASYDALKITSRATYARGMLAYSNKDFKNALPLLLQAAKADAGFPPIFTGLGMTYEALNDYANAKLAYTAALKLDHNNFSASTGIQLLDAILNK